jgi:hypothetical protein
MNATTGQCYDHRDRSAPVRCCATCQRIGVEVDIVTRTVDALLAAGWALATNDGEGPRPAVPTTDRAAILAELMDVDDEYLRAYQLSGDGCTCVEPPAPVNGFTHDADCPRRRQAWVRFVYGNDGYDVISDYSVNLDPTLEPVNAYADSLT